MILRWSEERERRCVSFKKQFMGLVVVMATIVQSGEKERKEKVVRI